MSLSHIYHEHNKNNPTTHIYCNNLDVDNDIVANTLTVDGLQVDGDIVATGTVSGAEPLLSSHLTTKNYVDLATAGGGDVSGPSSSTALSIPVFNGTTGKLLMNSSTNPINRATLNEWGDFSVNTVRSGRIDAGGSQPLYISEGFTNIAKFGPSTFDFYQRITNTDTTASSDPTTGSIITAGGVGVAGALNVGSTITATGTVSGAEPVLSSNLTTKNYVDNNLVTYVAPNDTWISVFAPDITNVASRYGSTQERWTRVGNIVTYCRIYSVTPTTTGTVSFTFPLPVLANSSCYFHNGASIGTVKMASEELPNSSVTLYTSSNLGLVTYTATTTAEKGVYITGTYICA